ncbi:MAG: hypothetical protein LBG97_09770 [Coriobacteriales bacterium]|jgi:hypothetical protein|nr:hypothetical protein [Coriobacteriales bacterium]
MSATQQKDNLVPIIKKLLIHYLELIEATPLRDIDASRERAYGKIAAYGDITKRLQALLDGKYEDAIAPEPEEQNDDEI